jgi:predicted HD phosphohydrolase
MTTDVIDQIFATFRERGDEAYLGEEVSQSEHALQAAQAAERDGAPPLLVASALLHDFGSTTRPSATCAPSRRSTWTRCRTPRS